VGVDVPPIAKLFTSRFVDEFGNVYGIRNSFAIYEQDAGMLWRHFDFGIGIFGRRGRQLVLTHTNTIGNYDYAIYWIFNQDGKIDVRVGLTGQLENRGTRFTKESEEIKFGELVAKRLIGTNHQHSMNFRLDFDLDGRKNRVIEHNTKRIRSCKENPCANAWIDDEKVLTTEKKAKRDLNIETSRHWVVVNENSRTRLGHHRGYALEPLPNTFALQGLSTRIAKRTLFTRHHLFVTRFKDNELDAMGEYPVEQPVDVGLKKYIANNENIVDKDIVLWYTINFSHAPRVEEHPLMPVHWVGFSLVPHNFFEENPCLDVDPNKLC
jgi:primary-amine oxidase